MDHKQKGFGIIELLIVLLILLLLGLGGWYVWSRQQAEDSDANSTSQNEDSDPPSATEEETPARDADWATYRNAPGKFAFKHPTTWVFADNPENCSEGTVLFAASSAALGKCATESGGQMAVSAVDGDVRGEYTLDEGYTDDTESEATAGGVRGTKRTATASGQEGVGILPDGTKVVQYLFYTNNKTYIAQYTERPTYPDAQSDFDHLVTKTLTFTE